MLYSSMRGETIKLSEGKTKGASSKAKSCWQFYYICLRDYLFIISPLHKAQTKDFKVEQNPYPPPPTPSLEKKKALDFMKLYSTRKEVENYLYKMPKEKGQKKKKISKYLQQQRSTSSMGLHQFLLPFNQMYQTLNIFTIEHTDAH